MRSSPLIEMRFALATDELRTAMEAAGKPGMLNRQHWQGLQQR
jgi:hypothetical protein